MSLRRFGPSASISISAYSSVSLTLTTLGKPMTVTASSFESGTFMLLRLNFMSFALSSETDNDWHSSSYRYLAQSALKTFISFA